jgi:hypothetical protein
VPRCGLYALSLTHAHVGSIAYGLTVIKCNYAAIATKLILK